MAKFSLHFGYNRPYSTSDSIHAYELAKKLGFDAQEAFVDDSCTIDTFKAQIKALSQKMRTGDSLFISFSGHGDITFMDPGSKDKPVQLWHMRDGRLYDFEISKQLSTLPADITIFVLADACFSGDSISRYREFDDRNINRKGRLTEFMLLPLDIELTPPVNESPEDNKPNNLRILLAATGAKHVENQLNTIEAAAFDDDKLRSGLLTSAVLTVVGKAIGTRDPITYRDVHREVRKHVSEVLKRKYQDGEVSTKILPPSLWVYPASATAALTKPFLDAFPLIDVSSKASTNQKR
jgi:Caspase domain